MSSEKDALAHLRHELRTPLNQIIGYTEMLLEDASEADAAGLASGLRQMHTDALQVLKLVTDIAHSDSVQAGLERLAAPLVTLARSAHTLKQQAKQNSAQQQEQDLGRIAFAVTELQAVVANGGAPAASARVQQSAEQGAARHAGLILVVDDSAPNRDMLSRRVEREGHRVEQAANGKAALEVLRSKPVDLVLLDVMMPEMDGYETLRQIKADPALRSIAVLMISAVDQIESVARCIELGAEDYLPKPFDPVLLRARIGACVEKKRLRDREAQHERELQQWNRTLEQRVTDQVALVERLGRLKRFFSPHLAELIVAGNAEDPLKTHRCEITVVFLDLRGFTAFAEMAEPEDVMSVLREYHAEMGKLVLEHEGTLERFTGDGMMVFFNDPLPVANPVERALRMALAMRSRVAEMILRWRKLGYELDLGIGIAQGYATIGAIGYEGRWDYGAIGSVTNLAARLCGEAKPGQILVSKRVLAQVEDQVEARSVGELTLKGFQRPVSAYDVVAFSDSRNQSASAEGSGKEK